ncbi:imelysin family protein [Marinomonas sp. 2405UD68-3]|uniref:imelysin family protein n=1 Tax=Marinomonas sp. 2405UD68-3 TaxID=3391835 RepID=UPI0039C9A7F4
MKHTAQLFCASNLIAFSLLFSSVTHSAQWQGPLDGIQNTFLKPKYQEYHLSSEALSKQAEVLCATPNANNLDKTRAAFTQNMLDWQEVQWLNFGPVSYFMRFYGFEFWPDKKGLTARQLRNLKQDIDQTYQDNFWKKASIAVKGLTAIETLLYRDSFNPISDAINCTLLTQITQYHAETTGDIAFEWRVNSVTDWVFVEEDRDDHLNTLALEQLLQQWLEHISVVKESKIEVPLGYHSKTKPKMAEFYLSNQSLNAIKQNLQTYLDLYHAGSPSLFDLANQTYPEEALALDKQFMTSLELVNTLPVDFFQQAALTKTSATKEIQALVSSVSKSQSQLQSLIVQLGFNIGFNSRDGD